MGALLETVEGITSRRNHSVIDVFNSWLSSFDTAAGCLELSFERALGFDPDTFPWPLLPPKGWSSKALVTRKVLLDRIVAELGAETSREPVAALASTEPVVPAAPTGTGLNAAPIAGPSLQPPPSWGAIPNDWEPRVQELMKFFPCLGPEVIITALMSSKGHIDMAVPVLRAHLVAAAQADRLQQHQVHSSGRSQGSPSRNQSFSPPLPCAAVRQQQIQQHQLLQHQTQQVQQMHPPAPPQLLISGGSGCSVRRAASVGSAAASIRRTRSVSPLAQASLHTSSSGDFRFAAVRQATPSRACIQMPLVDGHTRSFSPPSMRSTPSLVALPVATPTTSAVCLPPPTRPLCRSQTDQNVVPLHIERSISATGAMLLEWPSQISEVSESQLGVARNFSTLNNRAQSLDRPTETPLQTVHPFTPRGPPLTQRQVHVSSGECGCAATDLFPHASSSSSSASTARIMAPPASAKVLAPSALPMASFSGSRTPGRHPQVPPVRTACNPVPALPLSVLGACSPAAGGHVQPMSGGTTPRIPGSMSSSDWYASTPRGQPPATAASARHVTEPCKELQLRAELEITVKSDPLMKAPVTPHVPEVQANSSFTHRRPHIRGINGNAAPLRSSSAHVKLSPRQPVSQQAAPHSGLKVRQSEEVHPRQDTSRTMDHSQRP